MFYGYCKFLKHRAVSRPLTSLVINDFHEQHWPRCGVYSVSINSEQPTCKRSEFMTLTSSTFMCSHRVRQADLEEIRKEINKNKSVV